MRRATALLVSGSLLLAAQPAQAEVFDCEWEPVKRCRDVVEVHDNVEVNGGPFVFRSSLAFPGGAEVKLAVVGGHRLRVVKENDSVTVMRTANMRAEVRQVAFGYVRIEAALTRYPAKTQGLRISIAKAD